MTTASAPSYGSSAAVTAGVSGRRSPEVPDFLELEALVSRRKAVHDYFVHDGNAPKTVKNAAPLVNNAAW